VGGALEVVDKPALDRPLLGNLVSGAPCALDRFPDGCHPFARLAGHELLLREAPQRGSKPDVVMHLAQPLGDNLQLDLADGMTLWLGPLQEPQLLDTCV